MPFKDQEAQKMKKSIIALSIGILMLLGGVVTASADVISAMYDYPTNNTTPTWQGSFLVNQFDDALGTLNSVTLAFSGDISGTATYHNNAGTEKTFQLVVSDTMKFLDTYMLTISESWSQTIAKKSDGAAHTFTNVTNTLSSPITLNDANPNFAGYIGTGTISIPIQASASAYSSDINGHFTTVDVLSQGHLTVTYDYAPVSNPVPIPPAMWLLGAGLIGLVGVRRRSSIFKK